MNLDTRFSIFKNGLSTRHDQTSRFYSSWPRFKNSRRCRRQHSRRLPPSFYKSSFSDSWGYQPTSAIRVEGMPFSQYFFSRLVWVLSGNTYRDVNVQLQLVRVTDSKLELFAHSQKLRRSFKSWKVIDKWQQFCQHVLMHAGWIFFYRASMSDIQDMCRCYPLPRGNPGWLTLTPKCPLDTTMRKSRAGTVITPFVFRRRNGNVMYSLLLWTTLIGPFMILIWQLDGVCLLILIKSALLFSDAR